MLVDLLDAEGARSLAPAVRDLYAEVYAEPPYCEGPAHVARFVEHYAEELGRAGFSLARAQHGDRLVGVVYGWTMPPGRWFSSARDEPPPEIRDSAKFAIMEWMVRQADRGNGIGRRLLDRLLVGRAEPWAVLASDPRSKARTIYDRLGWRQCGTCKPDIMSPMDLLALPLGAVPHA